MTVTDESSFKVTIRDVYQDVQELKALVATRLPENLGQRLDRVEDRVSRHDERIKTLETAAASAQPVKSSGWTVASVIIAAIGGGGGLVAVAIALINLAR